MSQSGDFITATVGAMAVNVEGVQVWKATGAVERLSGQTAIDRGFSHPAAGTRSVKARLTLVIDITTGSLVAIEEGTVITDLGLWADIDATDPIYDIPEALVLSCSPGGSMGQSFMCDVEIENVGEFTFNDPN